MFSNFCHLYTSFHPMILCSSRILWLYCNLKTMSDVFCGWKQKTLIYLSGWTVGGVASQGRQRSCFFCFVCFWFILLFCGLLWRDLGVLILVIEHNCGRSMEIFYELCESRLYEGIGEEISGEWKDKEKRNIYDAC
jgi:hypothetical protein